MIFKIKKLLFVLIFGVVVIGSAVFCGRVFSYNDTITHPSLTDNVAKIYNANSANKLSAEEINWLKQGSIEEDATPRWLNHFYEPQSGNGLWGFSSSKDWAQSQTLQSLIAGGNQTWQKALDAYVKDDEKTTFVALGHVLHLLEDATVPAHTRLDAHPFYEPYENWVRDNIKQKINFDIQLTSVDQLSESFDDLANYSNKNFLSRGTIPAVNNLRVLSRRFF